MGSACSRRVHDEESATRDKQGMRRKGSWNDAYKESGGKGRAAKQTDNAKLTKVNQKFTKVNQYAVAKQLGKGAFGEVFLVKDGSKPFAMKVLQKSALLRRRQGRFGSALDAVKIEIATMKRLDHPNCVHMHEVIMDPDQDEIFMVLELVEVRRTRARAAASSVASSPPLTPSPWRHAGTGRPVAERAQGRLVGAAA